MAITSTPPPVAVYAMPADDAQAIALDSDIVITFKDSVKAGSGHVVISNGVGDTRRIAIHDGTQVSFSGAGKYGPVSNTITINPAENLLSNSSYYVQVDAGVITSFAGEPLGAVTDKTTYNFTTSSDSAAPVPLSAEYTCPLNDLPGLVATFNEPVKQAKASGQAIATNRQGDKFVMMGYYAEGNRLKLTNNSLLPNTQYFLRVSQDAITDLVGNPFVGVLEANAFPFTTCSNDTLPPKLLFTTPYIGTTAPIPIGTDIELNFSEGMKEGAGVFTLSNGLEDTRKIAIDDLSQITFNSISNAFVSGPVVVTIKPAQPLVPNSQYSLQADSGVVTDLSGNAFTGITDQSYTFMTAGPDNTPPSAVNGDVIYDTRDAQRLHISRFLHIYAYFNESVRAGAGNFIISNGQGDTQIIPANDIKQVQIYDTSLTVTPSKKLLPGNHYYLQVEPNAITDLVGNAYAGVQDKTAFTFTVESLWAAAQNPVIETNRGTRVGVYEPGDSLTFRFNAPVAEYKSFKLNKHSFGGNDVVLSSDGLSASVMLTADSTVAPGDVVTLEGVQGITGADGIIPTAEIEFTL